MTLLHLFILCGNVPWLSFATCRCQPLLRTWLVIFLPKREISKKQFDVHGAIETDQVWILLHQYA
jgi:hypothetical protein